jgi:hypothetical protein
MHYFDSRGVFRVYRLSAEKGELKIWRDHPAFRQRFTAASATTATHSVASLS